MNDIPERSFFRIHLITVIVITVVSGAYLYVIVEKYRDYAIARNALQESKRQGSPFVATMEMKAADEELPLGFAIVFALFGIPISAITSEWLIRRSERRKTGELNDRFHLHFVPNNAVSAAVLLCFVAIFIKMNVTYKFQGDGWGYGWPLLFTNYSDFSDPHLGVITLNLVVGGILALLLNSLSLFISNQVKR